MHAVIAMFLRVGDKKLWSNYLVFVDLTHS